VLTTCHRLKSLEEDRPLEYADYVPHVTSLKLCVDSIGIHLRNQWLIEAFTIFAGLGAISLTDGMCPAWDTVPYALLGVGGGFATVYMIPEIFLTSISWSRQMRTRFALSSIPVIYPEDISSEMQELHMENVDANLAFFKAKQLGFWDVTMPVISLCASVLSLCTAVSASDRNSSWLPHAGLAAGNYYFFKDGISRLDERDKDICRTDARRREVEGKFSE
jgi:hypothetical protein